MCKSSGSVTTIEHYYNQGYSSVAIDLTNRAIGLTVSSISFNQNTMTCSFTRDNSNANSKYFDLSKSAPYILVAYGTIASGKLKLVNKDC